MEGIRRSFDPDSTGKLGIDIVIKPYRFVSCLLNSLCRGENGTF